MHDYDTIVIGAGASGLMAAGTSAARKNKTLLLEKMKLPGRKIGISGKGRCNLTNTAELSDFTAQFGKNGRFLRSAFESFFSRELITFFEKHNFALQTERGGRVFPKNGTAVDVVKTLEKWVQSTNCTISTNTSVSEILVQEGQVVGVNTSKGKITCKNVILATGGMSYPRTGSTGDGYTLAENCGHTIIPLRPALVPLVTTSIPTPELHELKLKNVSAKLYIENKKKAEEFGEIYFTPTGFSGPIILTLSSMAVDAIIAHKKVKLILDLKPALSDEKLNNRLIRDFTDRRDEELVSILRGLLPKELVQFCLKETKVSGSQRGGVVPSKDRKKICHWLKNLIFPLSGFGGFDEAIVTAGGIKLQEINPNTMESKKTEGLYIVGELLDLHGNTGGYNLQAAFSTGWLAGNSV